MHENEISKIIIGCAMKVHTDLSQIKRMQARIDYQFQRGAPPRRYQTCRERPMTLRTSAKASESSALK